MSMLFTSPGRANERVRVRSISGLPLVALPAGLQAPYYLADAGAIEVAAFLLMTRPVTNEEFLSFVRSNPTYQRSRIRRVFADDQYLSHWAGDTELGSLARPKQPVTRVSWFAAKAFCESRSLRLPTEAEWEQAAAASETLRDARSDPSFRKRMLDWYATPNAMLPDVPHGPPNVYGLRDLHGVVWEWVLDFATARVGTDFDRDRFCGGGALDTGDSGDYAAYMRFAFRSSLKAAYTIANLGFRCAGDASLTRENEQ
jgi:formylglycine-generating enzyme required for sulfatase activity